MFASFQSTSFPFIQILPVPAKAMLFYAPEKKLSTYCASPQNGQRADRAWSGLRQCQQNRGCGVARARRRPGMSSTWSQDGVVTGGVSRVAPGGVTRFVV